MTEEDIKAILCCIIEHIRPDGSLRSFNYIETDLLNEYAKSYRKSTPPVQKGKTSKPIAIGDEVRVGVKEYGYLLPKFIVTGFDADKDVFLLNPENGAFTIARLEACHPTGKHFSQIKDLIGKK